MVFYAQSIITVTSGRRGGDSGGGGGGQKFRTKEKREVITISALVFVSGPGF